jgi:hypothetical protein
MEMGLAPVAGLGPLGADVGGGGADAVVNDHTNPFVTLLFPFESILQ